MTTPNPTDAQMKLARECAAKAYRDADPTDALAGYVEAGEMDDDEAVQSALLAIQATEARALGLVGALTAVHDDLLMRAEIEGDEKIVAVGTGVWVKVCNALATWRRT